MDLPGTMINTIWSSYQHTIHPNKQSRKLDFIDITHVDIYPYTCMYYYQQLNLSSNLLYISL